MSVKTADTSAYELWECQCLKCKKKFSIKAIENSESCPKCGYNTFKIIVKWVE